MKITAAPTKNTSIFASVIYLVKNTALAAPSQPSEGRRHIK